jgi:dUTP pyrophosphatase
MLVLKVKKLKPEAKLPTKNNLSDAAFDLYASEGINVPNSQVTKINTGIAVEIPKGYYGQIFDRSSMGAKGLTVFGGVIDSGYRGEVIVCLHNTAKDFSWHTVSPGDKIAQMVILPVPEMQVVEVQELEESDRGEKGFGSSGK